MSNDPNTNREIRLDVNRGCTSMKLTAIGESAGILKLDKILSDESEKDNYRYNVFLYASY